MAEMAEMIREEARLCLIRHGLDPKNTTLADVANNRRLKYAAMLCGAIPLQEESVASQIEEACTDPLMWCSLTEDDHRRCFSRGNMVASLLTGSGRRATAEEKRFVQRLLDHCSCTSFAMQRLLRGRLDLSEADLIEGKDEEARCSGEEAMWIRQYASQDALFTDEEEEEAVRITEAFFGDGQRFTINRYSAAAAALHEGIHHVSEICGCNITRQ